MKTTQRRPLPEFFQIKCSDCAVKCNSVLKNCTDECLDQISTFKKVISFSKGSQITIQGNFSNRIYFIKSGKVKIYMQGKDGRELIIRFAKSGEVIGFGNPEDSNKNEVSAMAMDDTMLCYLDYKVFLRLSSQYPEFAWQLLQYYKYELQNAEIKTVKLAHLGVAGKVADTLLDMYEAYGTNATDHTLNLLLSRQDIANYTGTTKEQVSKALSEFKNDGLIHVKGKKIDLVNTEALRNLSRI